MHRFFFPTTRRGLLLALLLTVGAGLIDGFAGSLGEPKRWVLLLISVGFFAAPISRTPLNFPFWLAATAAFAWMGRYAAGWGPVPLVLLSFGGASLVVRGGERAARYYLPDLGAKTVRRYLLLALSLFLVVFVADGFRKSGHWEYSPIVLFIYYLFLFLSAATFVRYLLLQSKPLEPTSSFPQEAKQTTGFVPAQRWSFLIFIALLGWSPLPGLILAKLGDRSERSLHLTAGLLMLLATALFLAALLRAGRRKNWPRGSTRWASFVAGLFLAHSLFAYLVDFGYRSDPLGGGPFSDRAAEGIKSVHIFISTVFLIVLPFVHEKTQLLRRYPKLGFFVAPPALAIMNAPMAAINGDRWALASTGFLFFVSLIIVSDYLLSVFLNHRDGKLYLAVSFLLLVAGGYMDAVDPDPMKFVFKLFAISAGFTLYALDLFDRAGDIPERIS